MPGPVLHVLAYGAHMVLAHLLLGKPLERRPDPFSPFHRQGARGSGRAVTPQQTRLVPCCARLLRPTSDPGRADRRAGGWGVRPGLGAAGTPSSQGKEMPSRQRLVRRHCPSCALRETQTKQPRGSTAHLSGPPEPGTRQHPALARTGTAGAPLTTPGGRSGVQPPWDTAGPSLTS